MLFTITEHCSLKCKHCFMEAEETGRHASREVVEAAVRFVKDMDLGRLGVSGGEPTEHPEFLQHFEYILRELPGCFIVLMTNGKFLRSNKFVRELAGLCVKYPFFVQVSALKHLYPHRQETVYLYKKNRSRFPHGSIVLVEKITSITDLGRAKGKDWSHLGPLYKRKAPMCFNLFSIAHSGVVQDLSSVILYLEQFTKQHCVPLVSYEGNLHAGETTSCMALGSILYGEYNRMYDILRSKKPCGLCGVDYPKVGSMR